MHIHIQMVFYISLISQKVPTCLEFNHSLKQMGSLEMCQSGASGKVEQEQTLQADSISRVFQELSYIKIGLSGFAGIK